MCGCHRLLCPRFPVVSRRKRLRLRFTRFRRAGRQQPAILRPRWRHPGLAGSARKRTPRRPRRPATRDRVSPRSGPPSPNEEIASPRRDSSASRPIPIERRLAFSRLLEGPDPGERPADARANRPPSRRQRRVQGVPLRLGRDRRRRGGHAWRRNRQAGHGRHPRRLGRRGPGSRHQVVQGLRQDGDQQRHTTSWPAWCTA